MKKILIILIILPFISSCDLVIRGVSKKAVETVETLEEEEANKPAPIKNGEVKTYFESGKIKTIIHYNNNIKNGEATTFYENGNIKLTMIYKDGKKHGPSSYFYENGKLYRESNYVNGELDGVRKIYNKGRLTAEVPYKNGQTGKGLKEYFTNGNLKKEYPKLVFEERDTRKQNHTYSILIKFSKPHPKDKFYVGELTDSKYLHDDLYPLLVENGIGKLPLDVPPNVTGSQTFHFVGVHYTKLGNSYVTDYTYELKIR